MYTVNIYKGMKTIYIYSGRCELSKGLIHIHVTLIELCKAGNLNITSGTGIGMAEKKNTCHYKLIYGSFRHFFDTANLGSSF